LATADAQRDDAPLQAVVLQRVKQPRRQNRSRRTDRMSMRKGTTLDVDDILGEAELAVVVAFNAPP